MATPDLSTLLGSDPSSQIPTTGQDVTNAQNSYTTAQTAANTASEQQLTLPQMLQQSFSQGETNNNPTIAQEGSDLANYQSTLANAGQTPQTITVNGDTVPLGPDAMSTAMTTSEKNAAAPLNADLMSLGLQNSGVLNMINLIASAHAQDAQQLTDRASMAYNNWQTTLNSLNQKAQLALGYKQAALSLGQLQEQQNEFKNSPTQQGILASTQMQNDAKKYSSFSDLLAAYMKNPSFVYAQGGQASAAQSLYGAFMAAHGNYKLNNNEIAQFTNYGGKTPEAGARIGAQFGLATNPIAQLMENHTPAVIRAKKPGAEESLLNLIAPSMQNLFSHL